MVKSINKIIDINSIAAWNIINNNLGAILIDVREDYELENETSRINLLKHQVINLPWLSLINDTASDNFIDQLNLKIPHKEVTLLFICKLGIRSKKAALVASSLGFNNCYNIFDGFEKFISKAQK